MLWWIVFGKFATDFQPFCVLNVFDDGSAIDDEIGQLTHVLSLHHVHKRLGD